MFNVVAVTRSSLRTLLPGRAIGQLEHSSVPEFKNYQFEETPWGVSRRTTRVPAAPQNGHRSPSVTHSDGALAKAAPLPLRLAGGHGGLLGRSFRLTG